MISRSITLIGHVKKTSSLKTLSLLALIRYAIALFPKHYGKVGANKLYYFHFYDLFLSLFYYLCVNSLKWQLQKIIIQLLPEVNPLHRKKDSVV